MSNYNVLTQNADFLSSNMPDNKINEQKRNICSKKDYDLLENNNFILQNPFTNHNHKNYASQFDRINIIKLFKKINQQLISLLDDKALTSLYYLNGEVINWQNSYYINGDIFLIETLFLHQIKNAIKKAPANTKLKIAIMEEKNTVLFIIHNSSHISPEQANFLLNKYLVCDKLNSLMVIPYNSKSIVEIHQGNITISSSNKNGTYTLISFPKKNPMMNH